jgi:hypothetical protein
MKKIFLIGCLGILGFSSCDKVENPFPEVIATELDYSLYPGGDSTAYAATEWPTFTANTNTQRNLLIEDFTGHKCVYCAPAADTAHLLHEENPTRVYATAVHAGPSGLGSFQNTDATFTTDFTNTDGLDIGIHFGSMAGTVFTSNPKGNVSRILTGGQHFSSPSEWRSLTNSNLSTALKVNVQSHANFYPSTSGLFLHTEVEILDAGLTVDDLYLVVYLVEDSIVAPQKMPPPTPTNYDYVHRDVMRGCISSNWRGRQLEADDLLNGKYYLDYSYQLPAQYDADNMHLLIYVRDNVTEEVYHVIKQNLQ